MTSTRSARSAATPRSWVISKTAEPKSRVTTAMLSRIRRWTVTSKALVGSSAMTTRGLLANAMAIRTRWRMPPDSWCGYCLARTSGLVSPASRSRSMTAARARDRGTARWASSASRTWSPTRRSGFSESTGSCGTRPISLPRTFASALSGNRAVS
jgi:hypothetical protein